MTLAARILVAAALATAVPAAAGASPADWSLAPLKLDLGDGWNARLGGSVDAAAYTNNQSRTGATAYVLARPRVDKLFANGWQAGIRATLNLYHDTLSGDPYGNDVFQKVYGVVRTPYGRVELGQEDGAAYEMAITGPLVAAATAIDDARVTFFRDLASGRALADMFRIRTAVFASRNAAKMSYYSPRLFGVRIGASYTPAMVKEVVPFAGTAPHRPDRQDNLIEAAINYTGFFGATSFGAYAGFASGHDAQRTPGHDNLFDWALGGEIDQDLGAATLAVGGAWHQSNGYTFDTGQAFRTGTTHAVHASTKLTTGAWQFGFEYSKGIADAEAAMPRLDVTGYEAAIGYRINSNLQLTAGWQHQRFARDSGTFYNGTRRLDLNAGFLYLHFHV